MAKPTQSTTALYDARFYAAHEEGSTRSARQIIPLLLDLIGMKSVCDVGCGTGIWLAAFIELGVSDVLGLDGDYVESETLRIPKSKFKPTDLNRHFSMGRRFDAAISLEVAEHLPSDRAAGFIGDLVALSPVVIFSAAIPGQGGIGHINERWPDYWVQLFKARGYTCVDAIRPEVWENETIEYWYRQNMFVFCDDRVLAKFPKLAAAQNRAMPLRVAHPVLYASQIEQVDRFTNDPGFGYILKSFPRALCRAFPRALRKVTSRWRR
jgi:SAM-dependent methyltransferase